MRTSLHSEDKGTYSSDEEGGGTHDEEGRTTGGTAARLRERRSKGRS